MTKKCPDCGHESKKMDHCENCGADFAKELLDPKSEENVTQMEESTEFAEADKELERNDEIEWNDYHDMSLGNVMGILGEKHGEDPDNPIPEPKEAETAAVEIDEANDTTEADPSAAQTDELPAVDTSALDAYIRAHRKSVDTKQIEELSKQSSESDEDLSERESVIDTETFSVETTDDTLLEDVSDLLDDQPVAEELVETAAEPEAADAAEPTEQFAEETVEDEQTELENEVSESEEPDVSIADAEVEPEEAAEWLVEETPPLSRSAVETNQPKKSRKNLYISLAAIALLGAGGYGVYAYQQNAERERAALVAKQNNEASDLQTQIDAYYLDDEHEFLKADMVDRSTDSLEKDLQALAETSQYQSLQSALTALTEKQAAIQSVNELFETPIIAGDTLAKDAVLKNEQEPDVALFSDEKALDRLLNQGINEAEAQFKQLQTAKTALAVVYKDDKVIASVTRNQYQTAKDEAAKVKNPAFRKALETNLNQVAQELTKKEEADKAKKEAEQKAKDEADRQAAEEAAAAQAPAQETTANQPTVPVIDAQRALSIKAYNQASIADASNPAWDWAPGVLEKVIQTCIDRGYVVEGGYMLEKVTIENGEGYYNLFATSNQSSLLKNYKDDQLPIYLVTINDKTGWFKGNGSR